MITNIYYKINELYKFTSSSMFDNGFKKKKISMKIFMGVMLVLFLLSVCSFGYSIYTKSFKYYILSIITLIVSEIIFLFCFFNGNNVKLKEESSNRITNIKKIITDEKLIFDEGKKNIVKIIEEERDKYKDTNPNNFLNTWKGVVGYIIALLISALGVVYIGVYNISVEAINDKVLQKSVDEVLNVATLTTKLVAVLIGFIIFIAIFYRYIHNYYNKNRYYRCCNMQYEVMVAFKELMNKK